MTFPQVRLHCTKYSLLKGRGEAQCKDLFQRFCQRIQLLKSFCLQPQERADVLKNPRSVFRQRQALGVPDEQGQPQALFQPLNMTAQGRLSHEQPFRRPAQAILLGHHGEVVQQVKICSVERRVCHTEKVSQKEYDAKPGSLCIQEKKETLCIQKLF